MVMKVVPYYDFFNPDGPAVVEFKNINTATNPYQKLFDLEPCPGGLRCARRADSEISDGHPKKKDEKPEGEGRNKAAPERQEQRAQLDASAEYQRGLVALMTRQFFR